MTSERKESTGIPCANVACGYLVMPDWVVCGKCGEPQHVVCGRLLVGQGTDTWDPICQRLAGHEGRCLIAPSETQSARPSPARITQEAQKHRDNGDRVDGPFVRVTDHSRGAVDPSEHRERVIDAAYGWAQAYQASFSERAEARKAFIDALDAALGTDAQRGAVR